MTFIELKNASDPGTFPLLSSLVFLVLIPFFSFEDIWNGADSTFCFGSFFFGIFLLTGGTISSLIQSTKFKKAIQNLAPTAKISKKIAYTSFFSQAADKRILSLVLQKYPYLSASKETAVKTKPQKIILRTVKKSDSHDWHD